MTDDEALELKAHADAALKLAAVSMEFLQNLAASMGKNLDFPGAAQAMVSSEVVDDVDRETFMIEKRSREIAAEMLMVLARGFGQA